MAFPTTPQSPRAANTLRTEREFARPPSPGRPVVGHRARSKTPPPLPPGQAQILDFLGSDLAALSNIGPDNSPQAFRALDQLHANRHIIESGLCSHERDPAFQRFCANLDKFVQGFARAVSDGRLTLDTLTNIETVCLGLYSCTHGRNSAFSAESHALLSHLSKSMLRSADDEGKRGGFKSPGQFLNIDNWIIHGLCAGVLHADAELRTWCRDSLRLFVSWARNGVALDAHNLGKCAIHIEALCHPARQLVDCKDPQVKQELLELMQWQCTVQAGALLYASPFDPVPLANVCTCLRRMLAMGLAGADDPALPARLDQVIAPLATLAATLMHRGDSRAMVRVANLLRQALKARVDGRLTPEMGERWSRAAGNLLRSCETMSFKSLATSTADLAHLLNLAHACQAWKSRNEAQTRELPGKEPLATICSTLLQRVPLTECAELNDAELARNLVAFLSWARSAALLQGSDTDGHLLALLQAIELNAAAWSSRLQQDLLVLLRGLLAQGFAPQALQAAIKALKGKRPDGQDWTDENFDLPGVLEGRESEPRTAGVPPVLLGRTADGFIPASHTARPSEPDARALAIHAALNDEAAGSDYESEEELESMAGNSTTLSSAAHGSTSTTTSTQTTTSTKDKRPIEEQLADAPRDYILHAPAIATDRKEELTLQRENEHQLQLTRLQAQAWLMEASLVKAAPLPETADEVAKALFKALYARALGYVAADNVEKFTQLLGMQQGMQVLSHRDEKRRSVLQIVIANRSTKIFEALTSRDDWRQSIMQQALQVDHRGNSALIVAAWSDNRPALEFLLAIPGVKQDLFKRRLPISPDQFALSLTEQMKAKVINASFDLKLVLEPDFAMDNLMSVEECDAFQIAVKNGSLASLEHLLKEPLILQKLKDKDYAQQVAIHTLTKASKALLQTMLAHEAARASLATWGPALLGGLITTGKLECVAELLRLGDARALLDKRFRVGAQSVSMFELIKHAPIAVRQQLNTVMRDAWNAQAASALKKQ